MTLNSNVDFLKDQCQNLSQSIDQKQQKKRYKKKSFENNVEKNEKDEIKVKTPQSTRHDMAKKIEFG